MQIWSKVLDIGFLSFKYQRRFRIREKDKERKRKKIGAEGKIGIERHRETGRKREKEINIHKTEKQTDE